MLDAKRYLRDVLDTDLVQDVLLVATKSGPPALDAGDVVFTISLVRKHPLPGELYFDQDEPVEQKLFCRLRFYTGGILRILISTSPQAFAQESPMLEWDQTVQALPAHLQEEAGRWQCIPKGGEAFFRLEPGRFEPVISPDGVVRLSVQAEDHFVAHLWDSFPLILLKHDEGNPWLGLALHIPPGEHFCGTGERFERPDLFGQQIDLVNFDAAGVNNPRAYKNIPFLLSSRGYGLFVHSSAKTRLDIGAHSTRTLQWLVADETLDLFVIGGGSPGRVLENYRRITGFPNMPPIWSFGMWMSRSSYTSAAQVTDVAQRLRQEEYPADVLHLDVSWFKEDWRCDWQFSAEKYPDPTGFLQQLDNSGFKVSLWQAPYIHPELPLAQTALEHGFVGRESEASHRHWLGYTIDLTRPDAVTWYQSLLRPLLEMGAAVIKTDFGEEVDEGATYAGLEGSYYHNLFALLYAKAAWDVTEQVRGKGQAMIWARSAWAGSQRYPVHWAGDAAGTYDALAGTLCGGLHFGLSGFAFWSHDVGGIHGIPDFETTRPSDDVYVRWTQVGVFSSHLRYHGGTPREPWEYPAVAGIVREWLRFRYALLPYILEQAQACCRNGLPMFRSLVFDWPEDPAVWSLADEYLFGDSFLVCPVLDASGVRSVYLPDGQWVDFWSGQTLTGPVQLHSIQSPLARLPLYVRFGSQIPFARPAPNTRYLSEARRVTIRFDETYGGFEASPLKEWINL